MKTKEQKPANLLEMIPVRNIKWDVNSQNRVVLYKPKFKWPWFQKHLLPRIKRPFYRVKLDDKGSFIWRHCNGVRPVGEIAELHKREFGKEVEPLLNRLTFFFQILEKNGFIKLIRQ